MIYAPQVLYLVRHGRAYHNSVDDSYRSSGWRYLDSHLKNLCVPVTNTACPLPTS